MKKIISYADLKENHQQEFNEFSKKFIFYAFDDAQFQEGMKKISLNPEDTKKIYSIGAGGYIKKEDYTSLEELTAKHREEMAAAIAADPTGDGFIKSMFRCELANHEYNYTGDLDDTLEALKLTYEAVKANKKLLHGLELAIKSLNA